MDADKSPEMQNPTSSIFSRRNARLETWLARNGMVLAASERTARSLAADLDAERLREGLQAWPTSAIYAWDRWIAEEWHARNRDGRMLLQPLQERALWMRAIKQRHNGELTLSAGRLAAMAQSAYRLLCGHAPNSLARGARSGWTNDAAVFSEWMDAFEKLCREEDAISPSRLTIEVASLLRKEQKSTPNPPLLLIGFDRLTSAQESLLDAWGEWATDRSDMPGAGRYVATHDAKTEIEACVRWIREQMEQSHSTRLMVIAPNLAERRGVLERTLRAESQNGAAIDFEFSLGVPLQRMSIARSAGMLLRWLSEPITETELDWLLGCGHLAVSAEEETGLQSVMLEIRHREWSSPAWGLEEFIAAAEHWAGRANSAIAISAVNTLHSRIDAVHAMLQVTPQMQSPRAWAEDARRLLDLLGWPGFIPLDSVAYQSRERWEKVLEDCAALGFDGSRMTWSEFATTAEDACKESVFAAESENPRVLIMEPLESAGQLADAIWFLGAEERSWPAQGQPHPLLPVGLQRSSGMPHASLREDWEIAERVTKRILASARSIVFSYAKRDGEAEQRPSPITLAIAGECIEVKQHADVLSAHTDRTEVFEDAPLLPFLNSELPGGSRSLTLQSLCPFQAFGVVRLRTEDDRRTNPALTPSQRGLLLHAVMRKVWDYNHAGGISDLESLLAVPDLRKFVSDIVKAVMRETFDPRRANAFPNRYPQRYLELESERLTRLVTEWLEYERTRLPFTIAGTEQEAEVMLGGLKLRLRLDRVDILPNGSRLILDYKTGLVNPKDWDGDRPEDVQLPLYACFAAPDNLEGLLFAQMAPGDMRFKGRVRNAAASLNATLKGTSGLVKDKLTSQQLDDWKQRIEELANDFVEGRANVDPKDVDKTCARCHLHAVCRIYENLPDDVWHEISDEDSADEGNQDE
ncbi:PD-(D/E)XK nuclease family protein [Acidicapsa dinghuensis]|uniref:PD-(D/E)XK nuclease family protein n=1 Tax=Acidicapsa dinghuensis TaxID=2218256 RepID=A0ABW1EJ50_9BACT|nr:PD-(D/E)XK nuclease family protein [Acidicapsa dinghuensis]